MNENGAPLVFTYKEGKFSALNDHGEEWNMYSCEAGENYMIKKEVALGKNSLC